MNTNSFEKKLRLHTREVFSAPSNNLYNPLLNDLYNRTTGHLKQFPFVYLFPIALILTVMLYLIVGYRITSLSTLLQYGF